MKTFLAPNQFLSAASLQPVAGAAASSPLSSLSKAAVTPIQSSDGAPESFRSAQSEMGRREFRNGDHLPSGPIARSSETDAAVSVRTAAASDLDQLANYFRRYNSRFVPDKAAIWDAMFDETAPRAILDPIWADDAPLFLRTA